MYIQLIYYKTNVSCLIYLLQPCHLILLIEGIALFSKGKLGVYITIFLLPCLTGTLLALFFPDTSSLDQYLEADMYWIQHYLLLIVPFVLLGRNNFLALKYVNAFTITVGILLLGFAHFFFFEVIK